MPTGRLLIFAGIALLVLGILVTVLSRFNLPLGRLPGDMVWRGAWRGKNSTVYFPLATSVLLSVLGSVLLWFLSRRR